MSHLHAVEQIQYNKKTGKGLYVITAGNKEVRVNFCVKKYPEKRTNVLMELKRARKDAFSCIYGRSLNDDYGKFIDFIATWYEPCKDMLASRQETKKDIENKKFGFYKTHNLAAVKIMPDWAMSLDNFLDSLGFYEDDT